MDRLIVVCLAALVGVLAACSDATDGSAEVDPASIPSISLIQLVDPLDEPEYYCIDIPGFGFGVLLNDALQAHTCKRTQFEDELFSFGQPSDGQLYMEEYVRCMEAGAAESGAHLYVQRCSDSTLQRFGYMVDRTLRLVEGDSSLCVAVAPGEGQPTGSPSHLRRDLILQECGEMEPALAEWVFPGLIVGQEA